MAGCDSLEGRLPIRQGETECRHGQNEFHDGRIEFHDDEIEFHHDVIEFQDGRIEFHHGQIEFHHDEIEFQHGEIEFRSAVPKQRWNVLDGCLKSSQPVSRYHPPHHQPTPALGSRLEFTAPNPPATIAAVSDSLRVPS